MKEKPQILTFPSDVQPPRALVESFLETMMGAPYLTYRAGVGVFTTVPMGDASVDLKATISSQPGAYGTLEAEATLAGRIVLDRIARTFGGTLTHDTSSSPYPTTPVRIEYPTPGRTRIAVTGKPFADFPGVRMTLGRGGLCIGFTGIHSPGTAINLLRAEHVLFDAVYRANDDMSYRFIENDEVIATYLPDKEGLLLFYSARARANSRAGLSLASMTEVWNSRGLVTFPENALPVALDLLQELLVDQETLAPGIRNQALVDKIKAFFAGVCPERLEAEELVAVANTTRVAP